MLLRKLHIVINVLINSLEIGFKSLQSEVNF